MDDRQVRVDPALCEGHALCLQSAPEVFDLSDDEVAVCIAPPDVHWSAVLAAVDACPRGAISISAPATPRPSREGHPSP
ncbi:ferredoxin [Mycolicibacterium sp. BiH015]|uniref:ferredoxin n=1 Tax=Mycolicibacterium sp. BiH015 TaxID=3018808 RepID=UPI0022E674C1|nr:ferredoxin [Mycolicibacterium sp. BiH015]MDA2894250.1 ferredoxin [Mycolicibacterium sp. BiH015]